ncbi:MAG TPA: hypothetical protein VK730_03805 [Solirubrobacteraceae bacterium]|nr:hypothetical protein [Solirubrobacteraceae bacterium]
MNAERVQAIEVPERTLRRLAEESLVEIQLERLSNQVAQIRSSMADPTASNPHLGALERRRAGLLAHRISPMAEVDIVQQRLDQVVLGIGDLLFPWSVMELPYMAEGIHQSPGAPHTTGEIGTAGLFAGGCAYGGTITQDGEGEREPWWVHTWVNSAVFPEAPATGRLYYRFFVSSECNIYRAPVVAGCIREYVTIGTAGDVSTSPPVDQWTTWQTVGWPIEQTLPLPPLELELSGGVLVTGSIPVAAGENPAIAFIYGTAITITDGLLQLLWGNFGTSRVVAPAGTPEYRDYDKIEYRFEPDWWISAVNGRLTNAPQAG